MHKISFLSLMLLVASPAQGMGSKPDPEEFIDACKKGHTERVQAMLDAGADVNAVDLYGTSALIKAAYYGYSPVVKQLITAGANVQAVDAFGETALIKAARFGYEPVVTKLIEAKADVNLACEYGSTALMKAVRPGHLPVVKKLITAGANVHVVNEFGETVLMIAEEFDRKEAAGEIRWLGQGAVKKAWFAVVVQHQIAASQSVSVEYRAKRSKVSDSGRVEVVE